MRFFQLDDSDSLSRFPSYKPNDNRISIFGESYGGKYLPIFTRFFLEQNAKIDKGVIKGPGVHYLHIDTMGIINGKFGLEDREFS